MPTYENEKLNFATDWASGVLTIISGSMVHGQSLSATYARVAFSRINYTIEFSEIADAIANGTTDDVIEETSGLVGLIGGGFGSPSYRSNRGFFWTIFSCCTGDWGRHRSVLW